MNEWFNGELAKWISAFFLLGIFYLLGYKMQIRDNTEFAIGLIVMVAFLGFGLGLTRGAPLVWLQPVGMLAGMLVGYRRCRKADRSIPIQPVARRPRRRSL